MGWHGRGYRHGGFLHLQGPDPGLVLVTEELPFDSRALIRQASDDFFESARNLMIVVRASHLVNSHTHLAFGVVSITCSRCGPLASFSAAEHLSYREDGQSDSERALDDHECYFNRQHHGGHHPAPDPYNEDRVYFIPPSSQHTQGLIRQELSRVLTWMNTPLYPYSQPIWLWPECPRP